MSPKDYVGPIDEAARDAACEQVRHAIAHATQELDRLRLWLPPDHPVLNRGTKIVDLAYEILICIGPLSVKELAPDTDREEWFEALGNLEATLEGKVEDYANAARIALGRRTLLAGATGTALRAVRRRIRNGLLRFQPTRRLLLSRDRDPWDG